MILISKYGQEMCVQDQDNPLVSTPLQSTMLAGVALKQRWTTCSPFRNTKYCCDVMLSCLAIVVAAGVALIMAAGNNGPNPGKVDNAYPFATVVAAS
jgi:hypothetical protein